ncbi:TonB-dependent receptor domain-containing protein [Sphingopyxis sp. 22461]|uniref:TonB-dependent receptor domain-containing protein n=1 Tax=Sphingopyxis sp. 22461 TaxID=3453923 RepID=UPI003F824439
MRSFNIEAQDAAAAIRHFARQSGIQILVAEAATRGKRSAPVRGTMPVRAALVRLLRGTGLEIASYDGRTAALRPRAARKPPPRRPVVRAPAPPRAPPPAESPPAEIIVTALRREDRLSEVPAAITVLQGDALQSGIRSGTRDYLTTIPGIGYTENTLRANRIFLRGVSDGISTGDPVTGIYLDEIPVTETFQASFDPGALDLERIEVVRGPQGTLYGAGAMGGTVRLVTRKPDLDEAEGYVEAVADATRGGGMGYRAHGVINLPIVSGRLAFRALVGSDHDAGWIDETARGDRNANTVDIRQARVQLLWAPGDDLRATFAMHRQERDADAPSFEDRDLPKGQTFRNFRQAEASRADLYSLVLSRDWDSVSLVSASSLLRKRTASRTANTLTPLLAAAIGVTLGPGEGAGVDFAGLSRRFTHEMRFVSRGEGRLQWLAGVFYADDRLRFDQFFDLSEAPSLAAAAGDAGLFSLAQTYRARQQALFGEVSFDLSRRLSAVAGLRFAHISQTGTGIAGGLLNGGPLSFRQKVSTSSLVQKYQLRFEAAEGRSVYAQASQGYRNGGPAGNVPFDLCAADLAAIGLNTAPVSYRPDRLWSYEIGIRNRLLGGRLIVNGAVYLADWRDMQAAQVLPCGFPFTINGGRATSKGAEIEIASEPLPGLRFDASASFLDARRTRSIPFAEVRVGDPLPFVARSSWNLSATYRWRAAQATPFARLEVNHVGRRWSPPAPASTELLEMPAYTTLRLSAGIDIATWSATFLVDNFTNTRTIYRRTPVYDYVGAPRTLAVRISRKF